MRILLLVLVSLCLLFRCQTAKPVVKHIELGTLQSENSIRLEFDKFNPISYVLTLENASLMISIYTHNKKKNSIVREDFVLADSFSISYFKNLGLLDLKDCNSYQGYACQGLDGSIVTIEVFEASRLRRFEFWSPQSQSHTAVGKLLIEAKQQIEQDFNIAQRVDKFYGKLKKGNYWNYGEGVLTK